MSDNSDEEDSLPPATPTASGKKRRRRPGSAKKDTKKKKDPRGVPIKISSRTGLEQFTVPAYARGHCKEYGDPILFPCGAHDYVSSHYSGCPECDSMRIIMDSWEGYNSSNKIPTPVPALTFTGVKFLFSNLGGPATILDTRFQKKEWDVSKPLEIVDPLTQQLVFTDRSLLEAYNNLSRAQLSQVLRPNLPMTEEHQINEGGAAAVPHQHRILMIRHQLQDYILHQAQIDGLLPKRYVKNVAENFGVVANDDAGENGKYHHFCSASGVDVKASVLDTILAADEDLATKDLLEVDDYPLSPRKLAASTLPALYKDGNGCKYDYEGAKERIRMPRLWNKLKKEKEELEKQVAQLTEQLEQLNHHPLTDEGAGAGHPV